MICDWHIRVGFCSSFDKCCVNLAVLLCRGEENRSAAVIAEQVSREQNSLLEQL